jgi:hypothetical protein
MAAKVNIKPIKAKLKPVSPLARSAPAANNKESPGKNGVTTKPVSEKIIRNRTK